MITNSVGQSVKTTTTKMAMLCICGVCIPYSVLWPLVLLTLRQIWSFFFGKPSPKTGEKDKNRSDKETDNSPAVIKEGVIALSAAHEFKELIAQSNLTFAKFTANWCKPCKELDPLYQEISEWKESSGSNFLQIDVDDFDEIAAEAGAVCIPYFVCYRNSAVLGTLGGNDQQKLRNFVSDFLQMK